jgi:tetratricopeptide (TPR) repeat protein
MPASKPTPRRAPSGTGASRTGASGTPAARGGRTRSGAPTGAKRPSSRGGEAKYAGRDAPRRRDERTSDDRAPRGAAGSKGAGRGTGRPARSGERRDALGYERDPRDQDIRKAPARRTGAPSRSRSTNHRGAKEGDRRDERPRTSRDGSTSSRPRRDDRRPARVLTPEEQQRKNAAVYAESKGWGGVARKGAINIRSEGQAMKSTKASPSTARATDEWIREEQPAREVATAPKKARARYSLPTDIAADVRKAFIGTAYQREKMVSFLARAAESYDRKRFEEALRLSRTVSDAVPGVAPVRELTGLAAYRLERWPIAKSNLRAYFDITGDPEHLPLVMDCERAGRRYRAVEKTFVQLEESEPSAEVLAEARIVLAASLADQKKFDEAILLLQKSGAAKALRNPSYRHIRLWYALADVYDRAGDQAAARELFARVVTADPDAYDAALRLEELGAITVRKNRKKRTVPVSKKKVD